MTQADRLPEEIEVGALSQLLSNPLILCNTTPYLSAYDLLNLAGSSRQLRYLVYNTPHVLRRLDLTNVKAAHFNVWRSLETEEGLTEDAYVLVDSSGLDGILADAVNFAAYTRTRFGASFRGCAVSTSCKMSAR